LDIANIARQQEHNILYLLFHGTSRAPSPAGMKFVRGLREADSLPYNRISNSVAFQIPPHFKFRRGGYQPPAAMDIRLGGGA